jgi:L-histidine N-alpha-methyltransferase
MSRLRLPAAHAESDAEGAAVEEFALDVGSSLSRHPRQLPSRYLYDALGSALFEAIGCLPWYRITVAEKRLLASHGAEVLGSITPLATIGELGSGSGDKLRILLEGRRSAEFLDVHLIDVSAAALDASARALESVPNVHATPHQMAYEEGLEEAIPWTDGRALVLFLGSNIGNYDPPAANALLRAIRRRLAVGDGLLLGADLRKPVRDLLLAYDDPLGVTAAFNRNLLVRINRELGGDFDLAQFAHRAVWNARESRIEMHLVARSRQQVRVPAADIAFTIETGEPIWTESSYKYGQDELVHMLRAAGFDADRQWVDAAAQFALTLAQAI